MAELRPFATAKQAADIGGITPTDIGVSATAFVRKSELVKTGKFDGTSLASYQDAWFVNLDAVKKASSDEFDVQPRTLSFTSDGGDGVLTITAPNRDWTATVDDEPVTPDSSDTLEVSPTALSFTDDPTSGKTIQVTTTGNWT